MNWHQGKSKAAALVAACLSGSLVLGALLVRPAQGAGKGYDTEWGFQMQALAAKGLASPAYAQGEDTKLVVSDDGAKAAGVFTVALSGGAAAQSAKVGQPAGVATAPAGFGSYAGQIFVLAPGGDPKSPCVVSRIDQTKAVTLFAKLPDAGSIEGGKPTDCRDLEFGPAGSPFANKLYASTNGNATIYEIGPGGQARAFSVLDKPTAWEITNIGFTAANDPKAPNVMLIGSRPRMPGGAKLGRINIIDSGGKLGSDPYLVGFIRPTGFAFAPAGFGSYAGVLFIADAGRWAGENEGAKDGTIYRVDKGVARSFASGLVDPTSLKFVGKTMVICDPAGKGKPGSGVVVTIFSIL